MIYDIIRAILIAWLLTLVNFDRFILNIVNKTFHIRFDNSMYYLIAILLAIL